MAEIGELMQPSTQGSMAPLQGTPPTTPEEHQSLVQQWQDFLARPDVRVGLAQFGTTMLSNLGTAGGLGQQIGTAIGDAGQAGQRNVAANQEAQTNAQRNEIAQAEVGQGQQRLEQQKEATAGEQALGQERNQLLKGQLDLQAQTAASSSANDARRLALEAQQNANTAAYQKLQIELEREGVASKALGVQTPRERAIISGLAQIAAQEQNWSLTNPDTPFDSATAMTTMLSRVDKAFPTVNTPDTGQQVPSMPLGNAPSQLPTGPSPEAIQALKEGKGTDAQFDEIFGPGAAKKARGDASAK